MDVPEHLTSLLLLAIWKCSKLWLTTKWFSSYDPSLLKEMVIYEFYLVFN